MGVIPFEFVFVRKKESNVTEAPRKELVRWAAVVGTGKAPIGRVVVEAETAEEARDLVERRGYFVIEVNRDNSNQRVAF
jgi:hypothetical protein